MNDISLKQKKHFLPFLIFFFFFLIYIASSGGHGDSYDGLSFFLMAENLTLHGSPSINVNSPSAETLGFNTNDYITIKASLQAYELWKAEAKLENITLEEYRSTHPFGEFREKYLNSIDKENFVGVTYFPLIFLASSLYAIAVIFSFSPIPFVFLLLNAIIIAVICVVIFYFGNELFKSKKIGFILSLILGVTSFLWPYITSMFSNPLAILLLLLAIYLIVKQKNHGGRINGLCSGLSIGFAVLSNIQILLVFIPVLIYGVIELRKQKKQVILFLLAITITMGIQGYVNYTVNGSVTTFGFLGDGSGPSLLDQIYSLKIFEGIYGFLFSPGQSIFIYFPISLLSPIGFYYLYRKNRSITLLFISIILIIYLYIAIQPEWYQNPSWGSHRYLLPLLPFMTISIGALISKFSHSRKWNIGIILLSVTGFIVNLLGNLVWVVYAFSYGWGPEGIWKIQDKSAVFTWNPYYSPVIQDIKVILTNWVSSLPVNPDTNNYFKVGLNGCTYDLYILCQYGILPLLLLGITISVIGFLIVKILRTPYVPESTKTT